MKIYSIHKWDNCNLANKLLDIKGSLKKAQEVLQKAIKDDKNFKKVKPDKGFIESWYAEDYGSADIKQWNV